MDIAGIYYDESFWPHRFGQSPWCTNPSSIRSAVPKTRLGAFVLCRLPNWRGGWATQPALLRATHRRESNGHAETECNQVWLHKEQTRNMPVKDLITRATHPGALAQPDRAHEAVPAVHHHTALQSRVQASIDTTRDLASLPAANRVMSGINPDIFPRGCRGCSWTWRPESPRERARAACCL